MTGPSYRKPKCERVVALSRRTLATGICWPNFWHQGLDQGSLPFLPSTVGQSSLNPTPGLSDYGCRFAHAEWSVVVAPPGAHIDPYC